MDPDAWRRDYPSVPPQPSSPPCSPPCSPPRTAVVLAAGRGRRLDRIEVPKPLAEVRGEPLLVRTLRSLDHAGITRAVVVLGHRAQEIQRALVCVPELSLSLEVVVHHAWHRGMVSSLLCARELIDGPFMVAMADHVFTGDTVGEMAATTLAEGELVCALGDEAILGRRHLESPVLLAVEGHRVIAAARNLESATVVDAGLLLMHPDAFDYLAAADRRGTSDLCDALAVIAAQARVSWRSVNDTPWFDVDTPSELILAERALRAPTSPLARVPAKASSLPRPDVFSFRTSPQTTTDVLVCRGFVAAPDAGILLPAQRHSSPVYVITDETVDALYGETFVAALAQQLPDLRRIVLPEGEAAKTLTRYTAVAEQILDEGIDERSTLISLGGGAVCNVTGFVASTLYRGIGLVHVPTTVMAQCDAAISHKQAINGSRGKNMIGSYYAPLAIVVDIDVLKTLDPRLVPDGLAEVIKHGLAQDPDLLEFMLAYTGRPDEPDFLEWVTRRSIDLKCRLVVQDPKEQREALVLHYGHTVGHAIEFLSGYELGHGHSIAIGMMVAAELAHRMGCCDDRTVELHRTALAKFRLPTRIPTDIDPQAVVEMMRFDKRNLVEGIRIPLVAAPGRLAQVEGEYCVPVPQQLLSEAIRACY